MKNCLRDYHNFEQNPISSIDLPRIDNDKIYMKGSKELEIYRLETKPETFCSEREIIETEKKVKWLTLPDQFESGKMVKLKK